MALPADFNKIYGSTATGGLTPIPDVDYAKGWEYVGSNPPTKNDFSYLQNFSDLKAQWLHNYLTTTTNAASRVVGTGTNQIPDMASFASSKLANGYQKLPGGLILQWGTITGTSSTGSATFPIAFPNSFFTGSFCDLTLGATGVACLCFGSVSTTGFTWFAAQGAVGFNPGGFYWMAIGF